MTNESCKEDRRLASQRFVSLQWGAVSWLSKSQRAISVSSYELMDFHLAECIEEVSLLTQIFAFMLSKKQGRKVTLSEDNEGALHSANDSIHSKSEDTHVKYH